MTTLAEAVDAANRQLGRNAPALDLLERARKLLEPTDRQRDVLALIEAGRARDGYPPTIRELADQMNVKSTQAVVCHLAALERKGFVTWTKSKGRTLSVTTKGRRFLPAEAA